jgi:hypothetical protein
MEDLNLHVDLRTYNLVLHLMALGEYIRNSVDVTISPNPLFALRYLLLQILNGYNRKCKEGVQRIQYSTYTVHS